MSIRLGSDLLAGKSSGALPSQSGQAGKFLTTNGSVASWGTVAGANADNLSITTSASDKLQTVGVLNQSNTSTALKLWTGTKAQYDAIATKDQNTLYNITDDAVDTKVSHNIGDIFFSLRSEDALNGAVVCDGSSYNISDYSAGPQSIKNLLDGGKLPYVSITNFDAMVTAKGSCRCFGYDGSSATTFKVPKLNDVFVEAGTAATPDEFIDAGLPNITSGQGRVLAWKNDDDKTEYITGSLKRSMTGTGGGLTSGTGLWLNSAAHILNASYESSIYGNSNTVQPNAVKYRAFIQLTNTTSDSALQDISSLISDMRKTVNYKNITNCITEIPQDIKLELNDGTITLKAGSKLYVPNGFESDGITPKFDVVTIASDIVRTGGYGSTSLFVLLQPNNTISIIPILYGESGPTLTSTGQYRLWYDTTNNVIKYSADYGSTWASGYSFPLSVVSTDESSITSLDQVFNGFGYIGSTVFALPGVKGLVPGGRNEDGTLKNIEFTTNNVLTRTNGNYNFDGVYVMARNNISAYGQVDLVYSEKENLLLFNNQKVQGYSFSFYKQSSGVITSFTPKTTFHTLDWNDKGTIAGWFMPSNRYIDLTLGASGTTYTAPANGMFLFSTQLPASSYFAIFNGNTNTTSELLDISISAIVQNYVTKTFVRKGQTIRIQYTTINNNNASRFYYAEGEV